MSGGVDSSTVAALLARQGHRVVGLTMQLWNQRRLPELASTRRATGRCCSLDDVYDARRVAEQIGIPYYVVNFERQFEEQVVKPFVERVPGRAHADSVHALQQLHQVRPLPGDGRRRGRRPDRDRPLRARRLRRSRGPLPAAARPSTRPRIRPISCSA